MVSPLSCRMFASCRLPYDDNRLLGVLSNVDGATILFVYYLPIQSHENYTNYMHYLSKLEAIVSTTDTVCVPVRHTDSYFSHR